MLTSLRKLEDSGYVKGFSSEQVSNDECGVDSIEWGGRVQWTDLKDRC